MYNDGVIMPQKLVDILESDISDDAPHCDAEIEEDSEVGVRACVCTCQIIPPRQWKPRKMGYQR